MVGQFLKLEESRLKLLRAGAEMGGNKSTYGTARRSGGIGERSRDREESVGVSMMRNVAADTKRTYIFEPIYGFTCLK